MTVVDISLPDDMKAYIEERVREGAYSTTSEYVRDLIREDQKHRGRERLEAELLRGLHSQASEWTGDDVAKIKDAVRVRLNARQGAE